VFFIDVVFSPKEIENLLRIRLRLDAHSSEVVAAFVFVLFARPLLAVAPDVLMNVRGDAFGVSGLVLVRFVLSVRVHDVHGVAGGVGMDVDRGLLAAMAFGGVALGCALIVALVLAFA
jgi:hypothetical protein